ncbi:MAG: hypothetical protein RMI94_06410, partial [Bryobacterales bacterium]|nr:hypothetical protein [Bryobacteraceae bacterium]MDW8130163.1 hypothetical protein [Bryobacterales bacterium]
ASLLNPYGWRLHAHIASYLRSDWIRNVVDEFQSPKFRSEYSLYFELLLFGALMAVPALVARRRIAEALLYLFWAHASLVSARHVPLFVFLVAPGVAAEATALWRRLAARAGPRSVPAVLEQVSGDLSAGFSRLSVWALVGPLLVILATPESHWPQDFPKQKFPVEILARHGERLVGQRVFTSDQWADYLIYRYYPRHKVYFDGRSDFYGRQLGDEYLGMVQGKPGWQDSLAKWRFQYALLPLEWPLAALLAHCRDWQALARDEVGVLYAKRELDAVARRAP